MKKEKKSLIEKLFGKKTNSCCCSYQIEEVQETKDKQDGQMKKETEDKK